MKIQTKFAFFLAAGLLGLSLQSAPVLAQTITDSFGQKVNKALDAKVTEARNLRRDKPVTKSNLRRSIFILEQVVRQDKNYYRAHYNLAFAYNADNPRKRKRVVKAFDNAIAAAKKHKIKDASLYNSAGWINLQSHSYKQAERYFKTGLKIPTDKDWTKSAINYNLGRLYYETRRYKKSIRFLNIAKKDYGNPLAVNLLPVVIKTQKATR